MRKQSTYFYSLLLTALFLLPWSGIKAATVDSDIAVGTNQNMYVPFYGSYVDTEGTKSQFIYLASELDELVGGTISAIKFYTNKTSATSYGSAVFSVKLAAVNEADFSGGSFLSPSFTEVYSGALSTNASGEMAITFSKNFTFPANKNLLIEVSVTTAGSWVSTSFYGQSIANRSRSYYMGYSAQESNQTFVPKATFTFTPSETMCLKPSIPTVSNVGATTATITWTGKGSVTNWNLQFKKSEEEEWSSLIPITGTSSYNLTDLEPGLVSYDYRVQTNCGENTSGWQEGTSFVTKCEAKSLEYSQLFAADTKPECWTINNWSSSDANAWTTANDYKNTGYALRYNAKTSTTNSTAAVLPDITISEKAELKFYVRNYYYYYNAYYISGKVSIEAAGVDTKEVAFGNNQNITPKTVDLSEFVGKTVTITFTANGVGTGPSSAYLWLDDVTITYKSIAAPTSLAVEPGNASANVTWAHDEDGPFDLRYRAYKAEEPFNSWIEVTNINAKEKLLEDLSNNTKYEVQVRAAVSEHRVSAWTSSAEFTPSSCPDVETVSFGDATYNSVVVNWTVSGTGTWDLHYKTGDDEWTLVEGLTSTTHTISNLTTNSAYTVEVKPSCSNAWVVADDTYEPVYTAPENAAVASITDVAASASWNEVADAPNGYKYVVVAKDATPNWTGEGVQSTSETSANLSGLAGLTDYDFYVGAVYGEHVEAAEKVSFKTIAVKPVTLSNTALSSTTATFTWEQGGAETQYQWAVVAKDATPETWSEALAANLRQVEITTGLTANTNYDFCVRSYYGTGRYSDLVRLNFTTDCEAISIDAEHPYVQNFDAVDVNALPSCWEAQGAKNGSVRASYSYMTLKTRSLFFPGTTSNYEYVLLPTFENGFGELQIAFSHIEEGSSSGKIEVGHYKNGKFTKIKEYDKSTKWKMEDALILMDTIPSDARLAFACKASNSSGYASAIDSVTVSLAPSCAIPTGLTKTATYFNGASFSWTAGGSEETWKLEYSTSNTDWSGATSVNVSTNPYRLSGLATGSYYARVKAVCGVSDESEYSNVVSFTPAYAAPSDVAVSDITASGATVTWTANSGETAWTLQYKKSTASEWTEVAVSTTPSYSLTDLDPATNYDVRILAGTVNSTTESFQTECVSVTSLPWIADFESFTANTIPTCWDNSASTSTNSASDNHYIWGVYSYNENKTIRMCNYYVKPSGGSVATINSPSIVLPASPAYELAFDYTHNSNAGAMTVSIYDGENWTDLGTYTKGSGTGGYTDPGTMTGVVISLADYANKTIKLRFSAPANYDQGAIFVDNVEVREPITCPKPTAVTVSSITAHTAQVAWTNGDSESAWAIQTSTDGTNWGAEIAANANPFTVNTLNANSTYYVRVKAICGENDESEWSAKSSSFDTPCDANALGWSEGFEDDNLPDCWKESHSGSYGWSVSNEKKHSDSYAIRFYSRSSSGVATLEAPLVSVTADAVLEYWHFKANESTISASVQIWVNGVHKRTKSISAVYNQWNKDTVQLFGSDYVGKEVAIKFVGTHNGYSRYLYLDDIKVLKSVALVDGEDNEDALEALVGESVTITINRTLVGGMFNTICLPFDLPTLEGTPFSVISEDSLLAFKYGYVENGELLLRVYPTTSIEAGVPYIIQPPHGTNIVNPTFENVVIGASVGKSIGETEAVKFVGILKPEDFTNGDHNKLFIVSNNRVAWSSVDDGKMKSFRAFFETVEEVGTTSSTAPIRRGMPARIVMSDKVATGVDNVQGSENVSFKVLENNQVVIIRNGVKYNAQGQVISK